MYDFLYSHCVTVTYPEKFCDGGPKNMGSLQNFIKKHKGDQGKFFGVPPPRNQNLITLPLCKFLFEL